MNQLMQQRINRSSGATLPTSSETATLRVGAVSYLNSKPLVEGLSDRLCGAEFRLDYPSRLADPLAADPLEVALIPSVEILRNPDYEIVSDACVAARGPVLSVRMYSRVPAGQIRLLALDEGSRTSATLVRIMLAERYGVFPKTVPLPLDQHIECCSADAILMIGDRAMQPPREKFVVDWDLGAEWFEWTGLPFVFAIWAGRAGCQLTDSAAMFSAARDDGVERLTEIARRESIGLGISEALAVEYLTRNLYYRLGSAERSGMRLFQELAVELGLAPKGGKLVFRDHATAR